MAINLIITETSQAACSIAFAFNGIILNDNDTITYKQRTLREEDIQAVVKNGFIKAKRSNEEYLIIWPQSPVQHKNSDFSKIYSETKELPVAPEKYEVELKETFAETLKKIIIQKHVKEVFIAYSTKASSTLIAGAIANFIPKETHVKLTCVSLAGFTKHYILVAFNNPISDVQLKNNYNRVCRKKLISWSIRENLSYAFNLVQETNYKLDPYLFHVMFELGKRNAEKGTTELVTEAHINMNGSTIVAKAESPLSADDVKRMTSNESINASFDGPYSTGFLTTADLLRYYEKTPEFSMQEFLKTIDSLFYKGYITNPYTRDTHLPITFGHDDCQMLLKTCERISKNNFNENHLASVKKSVTKRREQRTLPILPLNSDTESLTDQESKLYKYIVNKTINTINDNTQNTYTVVIDGKRYICELSTEKSKSLKRGNKTFSATISVVKEISAKAITTHQLFEVLAETRISETDEIFPVLVYLVKNEFLKIDGRAVSLMPNAVKIYDALNSKDLKRPTIFSKWGKSAESDIAGNEALTKRDVQLSLVEWIPSLLQMDELNLTVKKESISIPKDNRENARKEVTKPTPVPETTQPAKPKTENHRASEGSTGATFAPQGIDISNEKIALPKKEEPIVHKPNGRPTQILCSVCGKHVLLEENERYYCPECNYLIPRVLVFKEGSITLEEKDLKDLLLNKVTNLKVLTDSNNEAHPGTLVMDDNNNINFTNRSNKSCPYCKQPLEFLSWGMGCSECDFAVPFVIYGKKIDAANYKKLLAGTRTDKIDGLMMQDGQTFSAVLKIDRTGRLKLYRE